MPLPTVIDAKAGLFETHPTLNLPSWTDPIYTSCHAINYQSGPPPSEATYPFTSIQSVPPFVVSLSRKFMVIAV